MLMIRVFPKVTAYTHWLSRATFPQISRTICVSLVLEKLKRPLWDGPPFPEKPLSAYNLFVKEKFASIEPDADITDNRLITADRMKKAATLWKHTSDDDKEPFKTAFEKSSTEYKKAIKTFLDNLTDKDKKTYEKYKERLKKYQQAKRDIKTGHYVEPPKRITGYSKFVGEFMKSRPKDEPVTEYMKKAATAWHALPEKRRKEILAEGKKAYKKAKEQYEEEVKKMQLKKAQDQATMITGAKE